MKSQTVSRDVSIETTHCARCNIAIYLEESHLRNLRRSHAEFYCPNGHSLNFNGETEEERLKRELDRQRESTRRWRQDAEHFERSRNTYKGVVSKLKKRVGNGVCPECNRTFQNLQRHMCSKHPAFAKAEEGAEG